MEICGFKVMPKEKEIPKELEEIIKSLRNPEEKGRVCINCAFVHFFKPGDVCFIANTPYSCRLDINPRLWDCEYHLFPKEQEKLPKKYQSLISNR